MRSLDAARTRAQESRRSDGVTQATLIKGLTAYFEREGFEVVPANTSFLEDGAALLSPDEGIVYVDESLAGADLAVVLAHERGHLELHPRVRRASGRPDPIQGSAYYGDGAPGTARYHRHTREEAEATAFATEYVCPSADVFRRWEAGETVAGLAEAFGASLGLIRVQLTQALFDLAVADDTESASGAIADNEQRRRDDPVQQEAAQHLGSPALVRAGPGTGKTATLIRRLAFLLDRGEAPESILVLTFSNDAAQEIRDRLERRFDAHVARTVDVQTFHGFGWSVLRSYGDRVGLGDDARILDEAGSEALVRDLIGQTQYLPLFKLTAARAADRLGSITHVAETIARAKDRVGPDDRAVTPAIVSTALGEWTPDASERDDQVRASAFAEFFQAYEDEKDQRQRVDFADLIAKPARILADDEVIRDAYRERYPWVLVDEYQDVSRTVARLLRLLCGPDNPVWGVGDDHQAIYRFRGAAPENVTAFAADFPGAAVYDLDTNYRACPELVAHASHLAALLDDDAIDAPTGDSRWRPGSDTTAFDDTPVRIVEAESETSEVEAIVQQVQAWRAAGAQPDEVVVLARRNVDVRNVSLALGRVGIRTAASALVTADGPAGVLANAVTVPDRTRASLPRLAAALGTTHDIPTLRRAVQLLLDTAPPPAQADDERAASQLAADVRDAVTTLDQARYSEDGFGLMAALLFETNYLRTLLAATDPIRRALDIAEVVTSLSRAAAYRFSHPDTSVRERRRGFGRLFRDAVGRTSPSHVPAPAPPGAVRVMTLHASKGMEFPLVALVGQVMPNIRSGAPLLPPALRADPEDDERQADAAVFVGVTRAQRGLFVTFAPNKTVTTRPHQRRTPPALLSRWIATSDLDAEAVDSVDTADTPAPMTAVWGHSPTESLTASSLGSAVCPLSVYLSKELRLGFPPDVEDLYPQYVSAVRAAARHLAGDPDADPTSALRDAWPGTPEREHPHETVYRHVATDALGAVATSFHAIGTGPDLPLTVAPVAGAPDVRLGLAMHAMVGDRAVAVALDLGRSYAARLPKNGTVSWSKLGSSTKVDFALLHQRATDAGHAPPELYVVSAPDGAAYPAVWNKNGTDGDIGPVVERLKETAAATYQPAATAYVCDGCEHRTACPYWIEAGR